MSPSLVILYEDSDCLAVAKPAGQFTQGRWAPPGEVSLEMAVRRHLEADDPDSVYLGMVHRLDRPTSGVLLWAKTPKAARRLSSQFEKRRVVKEYWAIVELGRRGEANPASARTADAHEETWCDWLTRPSQAGLVRVVAPETPGSRQAMTLVQHTARAELPAGCAWLRLWPQTGRTHQLRRPGRLAGDADRRRCRIWIRHGVRGTAFDRAPRPVASGSSPDPSDRADPRRAYPSRVALLGSVGDEWWLKVKPVSRAQGRLISRIFNVRTPRGTGTSTCSPTCFPTRLWPTGPVIGILSWSGSSSPGPTRM